MKVARPATSSSSSSSIAPVQPGRMTDDADDASAGTPVNRQLAAANDEEKRPLVERLLGMAQESYEFGIMTTGDEFALSKDGSAVVLPLMSTQFKQDFARRAYTELGEIVGTGPVRQILLLLGAMAHEETPVTISLRVARSARGIVVDIGNGAGDAIEVTAEGWAVVPRSPVLFRRTQATLPLVIPEREGSLDQLRPFLNVSEAAFRIIVAFLVAAFIPDIPHPVLALTGEQGTAKSNATRLLVRLVDPSAAELRHVSADLDDWAVVANASYVVPLDNLSHISAGFSDALCRAATGDGIVRRQLYTDSDVKIMVYRRVVVLNTIDLSSLRGDLAERMLLVELEPISKGDRREEKVIHEEFEAVRGRIFGGLLDLLVKVLAALPGVNSSELPRMADFARVLLAVDQVEGWHTFDTYMESQSKTAGQAVESSYLADVLIRFMNERLPTGQDRSRWSGTATALLDELTRRVDRPPRGWPSTPAVLGSELKRLAPDLHRSAGIQVKPSRSAHGRSWEILRSMVWEAESLPAVQVAETEPSQAPVATETGSDDARRGEDAQLAAALDEYFPGWKKVGND